ncbi:hypothetical protein D0T84_07895 [Dysgonomonas sp. 521]|uniref:hypothetical protein n=1 Tax=Dysgonomonas sp. 521 TaxID=2302932 RepID=UPI0013D672D4|nr:hypothetical protein [Dysgonomonas sp. 521]NDV94839.1 hypothetical protein [Dysgonomonas sp. 521]
MGNKRVDKSKEIFGLDKIPDHILNKQLLVERGQREAYIQELEHDRKELRKENQKLREELNKLR